MWLPTKIPEQIPQTFQSKVGVLEIGKHTQVSDNTANQVEAPVPQTYRTVYGLPTIEIKIARIQKEQNVPSGRSPVEIVASQKEKSLPEMLSSDGITHTKDNKKENNVVKAIEQHLFGRSHFRVFLTLYLKPISITLSPLGPVSVFVTKSGNLNTAVSIAVPLGEIATVTLP